MSNHSQDSQPNKDSHPDASLPDEDLDFWNIDGQSTEADDPFADLDDDFLISDNDKVDEAPFAEASDTASAALASTTAADAITSKAEHKAETKNQAELSTNPKKNKAPKSIIEKISVFISYAAVVAVLAYLVHYASKQHDFSTARSYDTDTPAEGTYAGVEKIETWWAKPKQGSAKYGVELVPMAKITLSENSTSGVIRAFFMSPENELFNISSTRRGDPATVEFRDGKFVETGTNEITVQASDGFEDLAYYQHYKNQLDDRWTVELLESSSTQSSSPFKYLAKAPIEPVTK